MPDIVVHHAMGEEVLKRLKPEITAFIDPSIFCISVMGPDPYFCYRFFARRFRQGIQRRGKTMHQEKTRAFLIELARRSQSREMFSFLAGFLCHFALDSVAHPYINGKSESQAYMHQAIERRLDALKLERQGKQNRDIMKLFTRLPELPEVDAAIERVYGWTDTRYQISCRHMKAYHWIVKDQSGLLNLLLSKKSGKFSSLSFRTNMADGLDLSEFSEFYKKAVEFGTRLISAAWQFRNGELSESELKDIIGNCTYDGVGIKA